MKKNKSRKAFNLILAVCIALALWLYVINVENPTGSAHIRDLPIDIRGEETLEEHGLMVTDVSADTASFKFSGRKKMLMRLTREKMSVAIDVSDITKAGEIHLGYQISYPPNVSPDGLTMTQSDPSQVIVTVKPRVSKKVPVVGQFIGTERADHLASKQISTDPASITVTGPEEKLKGISYALVQIGGNDVHTTLVQTATVIFMNEKGEPADVDQITASATTVEVTVPVRKVVQVPLTVDLQAGGGAGPADVSCSISPGKVNLVEEEGADPPASISLGQISLKDILGKTSYSIPVRLPDGVTGWNVPAFASVTIDLGKLVSRQVAVDADRIDFTNIPAGYIPRVMSTHLYVWVRGEEAQVASFDPKDLQVTVDLAGTRTDGSLQRKPAQVELRETEDIDIGVVGSHYSVALKLDRS